MEWGKEIPVNGVRPAWLNGRVICDVKTTYGWRGDEQVALAPAHTWAWSHSSGKPCILSIRLPADHYAYLAIDKGFEPWGGGDAAPDDWDGGDVLRRGGGSTRPEPWAAPYAHNQRWSHYSEGRQGRFADIIGYRKRATEQPADTVMIARMTKAEAVIWARDNRSHRYDIDGALHLLRTLNLVREETTAERFTRETGITITPEIEKALSWNR